MNHEEIRKRSERITKIKPFLNNYNWEGISFPSEKDDRKKCEKNNWTIALNILYAIKEKIYPVYVSKHNLHREGWHYITVKKISCIIKRNNVKFDDDFYCLNCLHSFATENKGDSHKKSMWK